MTSPKRFALNTHRALGVHDLARHLWRSLKAYQDAKEFERRRVRDADIIRRLAESRNKTKLHIGAGFNALDGWINTDLDPGETQNLIMDAGRPLPIQTQSLTHVFCEHLIEHLPQSQGVQLIYESYRCLVPNGKIRIATPNIEFYTGLFGVDAGNPQFLSLYGEMLQDRPMTPTKAINHVMRNWGHKFIWSESELKGVLIAAGFKNVNREAIGLSSDPNLCHLERHQETVDDEVNRLETMVIEATKPGV